MNKSKLTDLLKKLNTLDRSIPIGETQTYLDQMVEQETKRVSESVKSNPTIKFLDDLNTKLEKFKKDFDLKPVLESIQDIQADVAETKERVGGEFESDRQQNESKVTELTELIQTVRTEFGTLSKESFSKLLTKISELEGELSFSSDESDKKGQSLKQVLDGFEKRFGELSTDYGKNKEEGAKLNTVLDARFLTNETNTKSATDSVEALRRDMLSRLSSLGGGAPNRQIKINSSVMSTKYTDVNFKGSITKADNNTTKEVDITFSGSGSGPSLEVNGTPNVDQTLLNLVEGTNMTITDNGDGSVTFDASGSGSGMQRSVNTVVVNTTAGATAATDYVYIATGLTLTLPTAVGNTNLYTVKNVGSSSVLVATTGGQTVDGSASAPIYVDNQALDFISDNSNWRIV